MRAASHALRATPVMAALAALLALGPAVLKTSSTSSVPASVPSSVSSSVSSSAPVNGETLGNRPTVTAGQRLVFAVGGFAPGATVTVRLECQPVAALEAHAGSDGTVRVDFGVSALAPGAYLLSVVGAASNRIGGTGGDVEAAVPRAAFYRFLVAGVSSAVAPCSPSAG